MSRHGCRLFHTVLALCFALALGACRWPVDAPGFARDAAAADIALDDSPRDAAPDTVALDSGIDCDEGLVCDGVCVGAHDVHNCGACGRQCAAIPGAFPACEEGRCVFAACNSPFADCNVDPTDGCEVMLHTDDHCISCATRCTGSAHCVATGMRPVFGCCTAVTACGECDAADSCAQGLGGTTLCCQSDPQS